MRRDLRRSLLTVEGRAARGRGVDTRYCMIHPLDDEQQADPAFPNGIGGIGQCSRDQVCLRKPAQQIFVASQLHHKHSQCGIDVSAIATIAGGGRAPRLGFDRRQFSQKSLLLRDAGQPLNGIGQLFRRLGCEDLGTEPGQSCPQPFGSRQRKRAQPIARTEECPGLQLRSPCRASELFTDRAQLTSDMHAINRRSSGPLDGEVQTLDRNDQFAPIIRHCVRWVGHIAEDLVERLSASEEWSCTPLVSQPAQRHRGPLDGTYPTAPVVDGRCLQQCGANRLQLGQETSPLGMENGHPLHAFAKRILGYPSIPEGEHRRQFRQTHASIQSGQRGGRICLVERMAVPRRVPRGQRNIRNEDRRAGGQSMHGERRRKPKTFCGRAHSRGSGPRPTQMHPYRVQSAAITSLNIMLPNCARCQNPRSVGVGSSST